MLNKKDQDILLKLVINVVIITIILPYVLEFLKNIFFEDNVKKIISENNLNDLSFYHSMFKLFDIIKHIPIPSIIINAVITIIAYVMLVFTREQANPLNYVK